MENYCTTTNANDAEFPLAGAEPDGNISEAASEPTALMGAGPVAAGGPKDRSMDPGPEAPAPASNNPTPAASSTNSVNSHAQSSAAKQVRKFVCIEEPVRTGNNNLTSWKPPFEVEEGCEASLEQIIQRADSVRAPLQATPVPTGSARYGTTAELFGLLQKTIAEQAFLPEQTSALLAYWTISTWFADGLLSRLDL